MQENIYQVHFVDFYLLFFTFSEVTKVIWLQYFFPELKISSVKF